MRTHKTMSGMIRATEKLTAELNGATIREKHEYEAYSKEVDALCRELTALWSNPADVEETTKLKSRLLDAWHKATS